MVGEFGATDALLRARRERPRGHRAAEQRDELAPPQLIGLQGSLPDSVDL